MTTEITLADLTECGAHQRGHFMLSSGLHSGDYLQCALYLAQPRRAAQHGAAQRAVPSQRDTPNGAGTRGLGSKRWGGRSGPSEVVFVIPEQPDRGAHHGLGSARMLRFAARVTSTPTA